MSGYTFTNAQAAIITGPELSQIVGPDVAGAISAAFSQATPDDQGSRTVELGEHRAPPPPPPPPRPAGDLG